MIKYTLGSILLIILFFQNVIAAPSSDTASSTLTNISASLPTPLISTPSQRLTAMVENTLQKVTYTTYKYGGSYFNYLKGIYKVDCSDYVNYMLKASSKAAYATIKQFTRTERPNSKDYFSFFQTLAKETSIAHWKHVASVHDLKPGDIIVYRYKRFGFRSSGHMMIVVAPPRSDTIKSDIYYVRVSDSAKSGHTNDTRARFHSGIGAGVLLLKVNKHGTPSAFAWKVGAPWDNRVNFAMARPIS